MISSLLSSLIRVVRTGGFTSISPVYHVLMIVITGWTVWRLWFFTIRPQLKQYRTVPRELPYAFPGHALGFISNADSIIERGKKHFRSKNPFTVTAGGKKIHILLSPDDVTAVYKNNITLSWDAMLNELLTGFGVLPQSIDKLWEKLPMTVLQSSRPELLPDRVAHLSIIHSTLDLYKRQLLPGPRYEGIRDTLIGFINRSTLWETLTTQYMQASHRSIQRVSLRQLCSEVLISGVTRTLFGSGIYGIEPRMTTLLENFNEDAWMLVFQYPQGKDSRLHKSRRGLLDGFTEYINGPESVRQGRCWLVEKSMAELNNLDVTDDDRASLLLMIYWAANINPYRLGFWMLSYITFDAELMAALQEETKPAMHGHDVDVVYLMDQCPRLNSVYYETLRVVSGALSARKAVAPTVVGGMTMEAGSTLLIPFRQLHYNQDVFGAEPSHFDPNRFLRDPSLLNSSSFRPFGGGVNYCPGRFLARQEMLAFTAFILHRTNIKLSSGIKQDFPILDTATPALGINGAKDGVDLLVDLEDSTNSTR